MKKTLFIAITTLSLVTAAGCKKKGGGEALTKLQETADKVCAAKDLASATKAQEDFAKWSADHAKADSKPAALSEADSKAFGDATKKLSDCYAKLASAAPATPPAAGSDAVPAAGSAAPAAGSDATPAAGSAAPAAGSDAAGSAAAPAAGSDAPK